MLFIQMFSLVFCLFLHTFTGVQAAEETLTLANFDTTIKEYKIVVVNFYADWCHFCKNLAPIYHEAAEKLEAKKLDKTALMSKVDCVDQAELCQRYAVNKYPTLKLFREGLLQKKEYRGARTVDALTYYMNKQMEDPMTIMTEKFENLRMISTKFDQAHILGVFSALDDSSSEFATFKKVASSLAETCKFYAVGGFPADAGYLGVYFRVHDTWEGELDVLSLATLTSVSTEEAITMVGDRCRPKVRELDFENAEEITEEGVPLFIFFYKPGDKESRVPFANHIKQHLDHEKSVNFLTADGSMFSHPLRHLGVEEGELPVVVIDSFQHMYKFPHKLEQAYNNPDLFKHFIEDLHSGKLHMRLHFGGDDETSASPVPQIDTQKPLEAGPPPSEFQKLKPNRDRYSMQHDEF